MGISEAEKKFNEWLTIYETKGYVTGSSAEHLRELLVLAIAAARAEGREEAAQHHDRKGDEAREWLDEHEQRAKANVVASWRTSLEVHRRAAVAIRALKARRTERWLPESEVREVLRDLQPSTDLLGGKYAQGVRDALSQVADILGMDLDAKGEAMVVEDEPAAERVAALATANEQRDLCANTQRGCRHMRKQHGRGGKGSCFCGCKAFVEGEAPPPTCARCHHLRVEHGAGIIGACAEFVESAP